MARTRREISGASADTTNNRMELTAAIRALEALTSAAHERRPLHGQHLREGRDHPLAPPAGRPRAGAPRQKSPVKNRDLWEALDALTQRHDVTWHWVKGHAGDPENERADTLAREALKAAAAA